MSLQRRLSYNACCKNACLFLRIDTGRLPFLLVCVTPGLLCNLSAQRSGPTGLCTLNLASQGHGLRGAHCAALVGRQPFCLGSKLKMDSTASIAQQHLYCCLLVYCDLTSSRVTGVQKITI